MRHLTWLVIAVCLPALAVGLWAAPPPAPVNATVYSSLETEAKQIRQFAFDGDPDSYFLSARNLKKADHFTLIFDKPVAVKSIRVTFGRPEGGDVLNTGLL